MAIAFAISFACLGISAPDARAEMPLPPTFTVHIGVCPAPGFEDDAGCAYPDGTIYVAPGPSETALLWHEIGHVFDFEQLTPADRAFFTRLFRIDGPWFGGDPVDYDDQPAPEPGEVFADEYEACARHLRPGTPGWDIGDSFEPSRARHRRICDSIRLVAIRDEGSTLVSTLAA